MLQCFHDERTNPIRLVTVNTTKNTVSTRVYAPSTNQTFAAYATPAYAMSWVR